MGRCPLRLDRVELVRYPYNNCWGANQATEARRDQTVAPASAGPKWGIGHPARGPGGQLEWAELSTCVDVDGPIMTLSRHPEALAKRASKGDGPDRAAHPSRAATRPPQDDGKHRMPLISFEPMAP